MGNVRKPTAEQRTVKQRNIRVAFAALEARTDLTLSSLSANRGERGARIAVKVDDVASGHASELLALLWAVALRSLPTQLPLRQLRNEVRFLC